MCTKLEPHLNYEGDEEDDTLSLCDLSIYSSEASDYVNRDDLPSSSSLSSSSSSTYEQDYFEFSSGDLTAGINLPQNIIFCGKLITCKEPHPNSIQLDKEEKKSKNKKKTKKTRGMFRFSVRKVSLAARSRWNLLMFGLIRAPAKKIEMSEMKRRQTHRSAAVVEKRREREEKRENGNGIWKMIRALGRGGLTSSSSSDVVVKASLAACCLPKV